MWCLYEIIVRVCANTSTIKIHKRSRATNVKSQENQNNSITILQVPVASTHSCSSCFYDQLLPNVVTAVHERFQLSYFRGRLCPGERQEWGRGVKYQLGKTHLRRKLQLNRTPTSRNPVAGRRDSSSASTFTLFSV